MWWLPTIPEEPEDPEDKNYNPISQNPPLSIKIRSEGVMKTVR